VDTHVIDLAFPVQGKTIPVDHGYALYGALSRVCPQLHHTEDAAVQMIRGRYCGEGLLALSPASSLKLRIPAGNLLHYITLAGKSIEVDGHVIRLGIPTPYLLQPKTVLYSHLVTTKNGNDEERFSAEIVNQLESLSIWGKLAIGKRRTFKVHDRQIVGYSVLVSELTAEESLTLQEKGLGGRRKMGCGVFVSVGERKEK